MSPKIASKPFELVLDLVQFLCGSGKIKSKVLKFNQNNFYQRYFRLGSIKFDNTA